VDPIHSEGERHIHTVINYHCRAGGTGDAKRVQGVVIERSGRTGFVSELDESCATVYQSSYLLSMSKKRDASIGDRVYARKLNPHAETMMDHPEPPNKSDEREKNRRVIPDQGERVQSDYYDDDATNYEIYIDDSDEPAEPDEDDPGS
jgi:hypothetical protein